MVIIEMWQLKNLCMEFSELGAANYIKATAPAHDEMVQHEAFDAFGASKVRRWVKEGLVKPHRAGPGVTSKKVFSRAELMAVYEAEKLRQLTRPI